MVLICCIRFRKQIPAASQPGRLLPTFEKLTSPDAHFSKASYCWCAGLGLGLVTAFVICCCGFKQHTFVIAQFLWFSSLDNVQLGPAPLVTGQGCSLLWGSTEVGSAPMLMWFLAVFSVLWIVGLRASLPCCLSAEGYPHFLARWAFQPDCLFHQRKGLSLENGFYNLIWHSQVHVSIYILSLVSTLLLVNQSQILHMLKQRALHRYYRDCGSHLWVCLHSQSDISVL